MQQDCGWEQPVVSGELVLCCSGLELAKGGEKGKVVDVQERASRAGVN